MGAQKQLRGYCNNPVMMVTWTKWFDSEFVAHTHKPLFEERIKYLYQYINNYIWQTADGLYFLYTDVFQKFTNDFYFHYVFFPT